MIQANELRIGNLVMINNKVITMDARIFHAVIHGFEGYEPEPIELTNIHALRLGFNYEILNEGDSPVWYLSDGNFMLDDDLQPTDWGFPICDYTIKYVHELQNAYRWIKGEELVIK